MPRYSDSEYGYGEPVRMPRGLTPPVQGHKEIPGAEIVTGERADRDMRDRYVAFLADMHARERISAEVFQVRQDAAMAAVTIADLRVLVADLPNLPVPAEKPGLGDRWKDTRFYVPVLAGGIIAAILVATGPFAVTAALGLSRSAVALPLGVAGILTGIVIAVFCVVGLVAKLEDDA